METNEMARILVAYTTKYGSTTGVAEAVARALAAAGLGSEVAAFPAVDSLEGYDGVVLGALLYMARALELAPFVARHRDALACTQVVAFGVGLAPAAPEPRPEQVEQARKALIDGLLPIRPVAATLFAGVLDPATMGLGRAGRDAPPRGAKRRLPRLERDRRVGPDAADPARRGPHRPLIPTSSRRAHRSP